MFYLCLKCKLIKIYYDCVIVWILKVEIGWGLIKWGGICKIKFCVFVKYEEWIDEIVWWKKKWLYDLFWSSLGFDWV